MSLLNNMPFKLTHFTMFVDGRGYAGIVDEIVLPKIQLKLEDYRAGGMDSPVPMEMGTEKLEAEFTFAEYDPNIIRQFGIRQGGPLACHVRGAMKKGEIVLPISAHMRGIIYDLDLGTWKAGDNATMKWKMYCTYYRFTQAEIPLIEIDIDNMVRNIGGQDQLLGVRAALLRG